MLFDKDYNFLDVAWQQIDGGVQVGVTPKAAHDYMISEVTVKEPRYEYVYVSNEKPTLVDFYVDDNTNEKSFEKNYRFDILISRPQNKSLFKAYLL